MTTYCPTSGKQSYATRHEAERVLKHVRSRPGQKRMGAGVYRCDCGSWHLSQSQGLLQHMQKAEQRRKA